MCTLIVLHDWLEGVPLVVAANRDEFCERPAEAPALRPIRTGLAVMPLDLRAGGTWLGLNAQGVFAAVTNRRCPDPDPACRSRGLLVTDALSTATATEAKDRAGALPAGAYNPFNLFVADREAAFVITYDGAPRCIELEPGVHVIGNTAPDAPNAKVEGLAKRAEGVASGSPDQVLDGLAGICRSHDDAADPLRSACVHAGDYATRSSILLRLVDDSSQTRPSQPGNVLRFANGSPCRAEYEDCSPLLAGLGLGSQSMSGESTARNVT